MHAYPDWKMMFRQGNEKLFLRKVGSSSSDKVYEEFWERVEKNPDECKYKNIKEGMEIIFEDQVVIHTMDAMLRQYYKENPTTRMAKTFPSEGEKVGEYMLVTENSPLGPILNQEIRKLSETGMFDVIDVKWRGKALSAYDDVQLSSKPLSEGQVMLIFAILCATIGTAAGTLLGECIYHYVKENKTTIYLFQIQR
jgi:hypothetical protein